MERSLSLTWVEALKGSIATEQAYSPGLDEVTCGDGFPTVKVLAVLHARRVSRSGRIAAESAGMLPGVGEKGDALRSVLEQVERAKVAAAHLQAPGGALVEQAVAQGRQRLVAACPGRVEYRLRKLHRAVGP